MEVLQALSTLEDLTEVTNNQDTVIELVRAVGAGRVVLMTLPQDDIDRQTFWVKFFSGPYRSRIDRNRDDAAAIDA